MITLTRKDLLSLYDGMNSTAELQGAEFSFAIAVNVKKIQPEVEALQAMLKPSEEFTKFSAERDEIIKRYGVRVGDSNKYTISVESMPEYEADIEELEEKYHEAIVERKKQEEDYLEFIEKESTVDLCMVAKTDLPKNITPKQMYAILPMVSQ